MLTDQTYHDSNLPQNYLIMHSHIVQKSGKHSLKVQKCNLPAQVSSKLLCVAFKHRAMFKAPYPRVNLEISKNFEENRSIFILLSKSNNILLEVWITPPPTCRYVLIWSVIWYLSNTCMVNMKFRHCVFLLYLGVNLEISKNFKENRSIFTLLRINSDIFLELWITPPLCDGKHEWKQYECLLPHHFVMEY